MAQLENEDEFEEYVEGLDIQDVDRNADWMGVARTGANILPPSPPLGGRAINAEYAWDQTFPNYEDPNILKVFLEVQKRMADNEIINQPNLILQDALPRDAFSEEQKQVIELFEQQISYLNGNRNVDPKKSVIVQGKAGSGKSALIKYITSQLTLTFGEDSFALLAPTGAAAVNINGSTIHSKLAIGIDARLRPLSP